jgi:hypothetical protein
VYLSSAQETPKKIHIYYIYIYITLTLSWLVSVLLRNPLLVFQSSFVCNELLILLLLSKFYSSLIFDSLIIMYLCLDSSRFNLLGILQTSWIWNPFSSPDLERFWPSFLQIHFLLLSLCPILLELQWHR